MFTGIISKTSKVKKVRSDKDNLFVDVVNNLGKIKRGSSININGVCSTVKALAPGSIGGGKIISFEYMPETLKLTNMSSLKVGDSVNIEQSMRMNDLLDGHVVLGHIDGKGEILNIKKEGNSKMFEIKMPNPPSHKASAGQGNFMKFLVYKGSVAIEGISLTVTKVAKNSFEVKVLPYTLEHTNLKNKKIGDELNLEFDILAKYAHGNKK